jgi:5-oxoprolinase (ATP-hydrolysing)
VDKDAKAHSVRSVYFGGGRVDTPVYTLESLAVGDTVSGPAILADGTQTLVVAPASRATVLKTHVVVDIEAEAKTKNESEEGEPVDAAPIDPIMLSIFGHRFMAIAEQMGRALQKTSVSTNIKERLDFSCAIFDPEGALVAVSASSRCET